MEQDFSRGHLEELLKERTEEYKMYPTERVWNGIYHRLHTRRKWHFIGGGTFALMILAGVFLLIQDNTRHTDKNPSALAAGGRTGLRTTYAPGREAPGKSPRTIINKKSLSLADIGGAAASLNLTGALGNNILAAHLNPTLSSLGQLSNGGAVTDGGNITDGGPVTDWREAGTDNEAIAAPVNHNLSPTQSNSLLRTAAPWENISTLASTQKTLLPSRTDSRFSWLFHFEPSISFRTLKNKGFVKSNYGFIVVDNNSYDINNLVDQRPSIGFEVGTDFFYSLTSRLRLKAGLQFNYSRYTAQAYTAPSRPVVVTLGGPGTGGIQRISQQATSSYENASSPMSPGAIWIPDQRVELSLPVGAEFQILHARNISWNVAGSVQPTYILNARAFVLSDDYKHYVMDPNLLRRWNINAALETFLRISKGKVQLQIGPQFRYQLQPSFNNSYPIKEHLYDVGFKIGITQNIR